MKKVMGADDFGPLVPPGSAWGSPEEKERRRRIVVAHAAYAYEIANDPIMSDNDWDRLAERIDRSMSTGHPVLDAFFRDHFSPMTAMWIHGHPELDGIAALYRRYRSAVPSTRRQTCRL